MLRGMVLLALTVSVVAVVQEQGPRVFSIRTETLLNTKARLADGDEQLQPAYEQLLAEAEEALAAGPFSVVYKTLVPLSGDKHDYQSFGPYWWPDPDKSDGLPYIRRDGEVNPESRTSASDAPRLSRFANAVETLALAYYLSGRERYAQHATSLIRTWFMSPETRMNPHLEYGQAIPGRVDGRGIGIIESRHFVDVVDAVGLLEGADAWTPEDQEQIESWFAEFLEWLLTSSHGQDEARHPNNHGSWYDVQVASFGLFLGREDLVRRLLEESKHRRIEAHIAEDGRQPHELDRTRSFDYSVFNLEALVTLARMGERLGVDLWTYQPEGKEGLRAAVAYLAPYAEPGKAWPYPQISTLNRARLYPLLREAAWVYDDDGFDQLGSLLLDDQSRLSRVVLQLPNR